MVAEEEWACLCVCCVRMIHVNMKTCSPYFQQKKELAEITFHYTLHSEEKKTARELHNFDA